MLTYAGKGYSAAFTDNYDAIIARLGNGEDLILVSGPDDICQPLLGDNQAHCFRDSVTRRDEQAAAAVSALLGSPIQPDSVFKLDKAVVERMREAFAAGTPAPPAKAANGSTSARQPLKRALPALGYR